MLHGADFKGAYSNQQLLVNCMQEMGNNERYLIGPTPFLINQYKSMEKKAGGYIFFLLMVRTPDSSEGRMLD